MQYGIAINLEWVGDLPALKQLVARLDDSSFDFVMMGGHVLSAAPGRYPDRPVALYASGFRDPFVFFSYLAARTTRLHFRTGILILPLFPTALVAKQAAELSIMSDGRFEIGVGIGWQDAEYRGMGQDPRGRGQRFEEQLQVLRLLWSAPTVNFHGRFHDIDGVGIGQLPHAPIPIWVGCTPLTELLKRVAQHADGWIPQGPFDANATIATLRAANLDRATPVGVMARVAARPDDLPSCVAECRALVAAGVSEITILPPPGLGPLEALDAVTVTQRALGEAVGA